MLIILENEL